jgi:hypothetical protein
MEAGAVRRRAFGALLPGPHQPDVVAAPAQAFYKARDGQGHPLISGG